MIHAIAYEGDALDRATGEQRAAFQRLKGRCSIRGVILLADSTLQVGFEGCDGHDREALIDRGGTRVSTRFTWELIIAAKREKAARDRRAKR